MRLTPALSALFVLPLIFAACGAEDNDPPSDGADVVPGDSSTPPLDTTGSEDIVSDTSTEGADAGEPGTGARRLLSFHQEENVCLRTGSVVDLWPGIVNIALDDGTS